MKEHTPNQIKKILRDQNDLTRSYLYLLYHITSLHVIITYLKSKMNHLHLFHQISNVLLTRTPEIAVR